MLLATQILSYYTVSNSYVSLVLSKLPKCDYYVRSNFKIN